MFMIEKNKVFVVSKNLQIYADLFGQSRSFLGSEVLGRLGEPVLISGPLYSVKKPSMLQIRTNKSDNLQSSRNSV